VNAMSTGCESYQQAISRRTALKVGIAGMVPWLFAPSALAQVKLTPQPRDHALVVLFLRGGSDGLNMVVPYEEDAYYRARPTLAIAKPNDNRVPTAARSEKLTDQFALHPSLRPLKHWYDEGLMTLAHAVGSQDLSRSHFEAMSAMERGATTGRSGDPSGWLARYIQKTHQEGDTPLRAVAWADTLPDSLRGGMPPVVVQSIADFKLDVADGFMDQIQSTYSDSDLPIAIAGRNALDALSKIDQLNVAGYQAANSAAYPDSAIGKGFKEVAALLKAGVGLEIACLEDTGWDTHVAQGSDTGIHANGLSAVAQSIDAFMRDLGDRGRKISLIVMTEFGRRVEENAGLGTDHGRASVMMAFGAVDGGKIAGGWPGMSKNQLDEVGDLKPVNDYRKMLTQFLQPHMPEIANVWS
jgi:uncharacterized protein (DUF1501 family)